MHRNALSGYNLELLKNKLKSFINTERFKHSLGVMEVAEKLAVHYGYDSERAKIAGLLHDCAKGYSEEELLQMAKKYNLVVDEIQRLIPQLLHGPIGACILPEEFGVKDPVILDAVKYHSTGKPGMHLLEKIIFLADYIEPNRRCPGLDRLRKVSFKDLNRAIVDAAERTIIYHLQKGELVHPLTLATRNYYLGKGEANGGQEDG